MPTLLRWGWGWGCWLISPPGINSILKVRARGWLAKPQEKHPLAAGPCGPITPRAWWKTWSFFLFLCLLILKYVSNRIRSSFSPRPSPSLFHSGSPSVHLSGGLFSFLLPSFPSSFLHQPLSLCQSLTHFRKKKLGQLSTWLVHVVWPWLSVGWKDFSLGFIRISFYLHRSTRGSHSSPRLSP